MLEPDMPPWPVGTLMSRLPPRTSTALLGLGVPQRVGEGRVLIREGTVGSHVVLLQQGIAKVTGATADGRSALLSC